MWLTMDLQLSMLILRAISFTWEMAKALAESESIPMPRRIGV